MPSDAIETRQSPFQLPPLQQQTRATGPTSMTNFPESQHAESVGSLSPVDSSQAGFIRSNDSPSAAQKDANRDRRISAACSACKKRKSKCTGGPPPCKLCSISGIECVINESLDGRRKLAAKRVQDELQQQKAFLDALLEGLRQPERKDKLLELIQSRAPLAALSDQLLAPPGSTNHGRRTRVPIELLIEAEDVISQRTSNNEQETFATNTVPSPHRFGLSSPTPTPADVGLRPSVSYQGVEPSLHHYRGLVHTLRDCPDAEAMYLLQELRRVSDIPRFLETHGDYTTAAQVSTSADHMT